jgi:hypothetical protein
MSSKQRTSLAALISASQKEGLGGYFLETLFVEIDSLDRYARTHPIVFGPGFYYAFQRMLAELLLSLYLIEAAFNSLGQRKERNAVGSKHEAVGNEQCKGLSS